jgi:glycosyltransferase involved in cell wall biosynthesis
MQPRRKGSVRTNGERRQVRLGTPSQRGGGPVSSGASYTVDPAGDHLEMKTIGVFYSPEIGGPWHIHNALMKPGEDRRVIHFLVGDPAPDLLETAKSHGLEHIRIPYKSRRDLPLAILRTRRALRSHGVQLVHGHGIQGSLVGLLAALTSGVSERLHTRHHATMHHEGGPRHAQLVDRIVNRLSTTIIATCSNVRSCLIDRENVDPAKIRLLEYRLDIRGFDEVSEERVAAVRTRYQLLPTQRTVGMITRFVWWKGVEYGLAAFTRFLTVEPDAILVIAKPIGPHESAIRPLLDLIPERNYRLIEHEQDIAALYKTFDFLMHLPVTAGVEAWGQVYVEAMAAGIPMICTRSGIGNDLLHDGENCVLVDYRDDEAALAGLIRLASDESLRSLIIANGRNDATRFSRSSNLNTLDFLYGTHCNNGLTSPPPG